MLNKIKKIDKWKNVICPDCGKTIRVTWQDEERTYVEIERVYATRIDCMSVTAGGRIAV